jgi:CRP/FNR family nitrogen fixation transcriptional regulator
MQMSPAPRRQLGAPAPGAANPPKRQEIHLIGATMYVMRDQEVFGEGERVRQVYKVVRGAIRGFQVLSGGRRQICDFYLPGDVFGVHLNAKHRIATEAVTDTVLVVAQRSELRLDHDRAAVRRLWNLAMSKLRRSQDHALAFRRRSASGRVAGFLVDMVERIGIAESVELPMSRQDIADYLGLTIETVSGALTQLHISGAITLTGSRAIHLRTPHALAELCA